MDLTNFHILLKFLSYNGIRASKLNYAINTSSNEVCELIYTDKDSLDKFLSHSCFHMSRFIRRLFSISNIKQNYKGFNTFKENFKDGKIFTFSTFSHNFNIIKISRFEIYLIDYYSETQRPNLFRIIKFKSQSQALEIIKEALFTHNLDAYKNLFDFKNNSCDYFNRDEWENYTNFEIDDFDYTADIYKLIEMWKDSEKDFLKEIEIYKTTGKSDLHTIVEYENYTGNFEDFRLLFYEQINLMITYYNSYIDENYFII